MTDARREAGIVRRLSNWRALAPARADIIRVEPFVTSMVL